MAGRGSVFKLSNGRWAFQYSTTDAGGERRQVRRSFPTKREAEQQRTKIYAQLDSGQDPYSDKLGPTVAQYVDQWREFHRRNVRETTWNGYEHALADIVAIIGPMRLGQVKAIHVQQVLDHCANRGLAPKTIIQARAVMGKMFKQAMRWELMTSNPVQLVDRPKDRHVELVVPDLAGLRKILDAFAGSIWEAPTLLAVTLGTRRGEVLALRWKDVDLDTGRVSIYRSIQRVNGRIIVSEPKTERGRRVVTLTTSAREHLRRLKATQRERLFARGVRQTDETVICDNGRGQLVSPDGFSHAFITMAAECGFPGMRLHDARHAVATALMEANVHPGVTSAILGHADPGFTMRVYQHVKPELADEAAAALERKQQQS